MAKSKVSVPNVPNVPKAQSTANKAKNSKELLYGRDFYIWMLAGLLLIVIGFFLMAGGHQEPNEWNPDEIYSVRRTVIAPLFMIIGLIVEVYAIFKK